VIHHLAKVTEHLANTSELEAAIHGIAMYSCTSGKPSRFYLGRSLNNFEVSYEMAMGFDTDFSQYSQYGGFISEELTKGHPAHHSLIFVDHSPEYKKIFKERVGIDEHPKWKSSVLMQIIPSYFAAFSSEIHVGEDVDNVNYFNAIRSITALFLKGLVDSLVRQNAVSEVSHQGDKKNINGQSLTERQALILKKIQSGETNISVAESLGYSESLIRQETITIYRKLGISGRKDLDIEKRP
jgi:DNA-binding CsgD family transcriptional regulator